MTHKIKNSRLSHRTRWTLTALVLLSTLVILPGIRRDLPYANDFDGPTWVTMAVRMAATGNLNPQWFGHPGSTVITPLTVLYHTWYAVTGQGSLLRFNPGIQTHFDSGHAWEYYLLGRLLTASYYVLSVPLVYFLGTRSFGRHAALPGTILYLFFPQTVFYARMVRSDSAATFFAVLCLWRCAIILKKPAIRNQVLAGAVWGLAVASRCFTAALAVVYLGTNVRHYMKLADRAAKRCLFLAVTIGGVTAVLAFALITPYFFLDFATVLHDFRVESRMAHLGFDGLTPTGNFPWYLTTGIPRSMTWVPALVALFGTGFSLRQRPPIPKLLVGYVVAFLFTISLPALHWPRWTLQILPVLALFAAHAVNHGTATIGKWCGWEWTPRAARFTKWAHCQKLG
ncbi:MAG: glycosyltransferase family 39 protein [Anaerolineae bacterium]|nr:glycosyltransferase family 39 protein [Anaerolineae bacterium]